MNSAVVRTAPPPEWSAAALAQQLIDGESSPLDLSIGQTLATAWALKDACYAAWSSQPQRAGPAAQAVASLRQQAQAQGGLALEPDLELAAVADWTEGIALITASRMDEAATLLARACDQFTTLQQADHAAQTQVPRIMALTMAGRHAEAAVCGELTQKEFLRLKDTHSAGKVSLNLGGLQLARDDHRNAAVHYRQAAVLFARSGDIQHSVMADIGLGKALSAVGEMEEAVRIYARARMRATTHNLPVLRAFADEAMAMLDLARGRFRDALQGFERTRRSYEELAMSQNLAVAEVQLGEAYLELRLLPESVALFERALQSMQALGMADEQAWTQLQIARALAMLGRTGQAAPLLGQAAATFATQSNEVGLASVMLAQSELAMAQGQAQQALTWADDAMHTFGRQGLADGEVRAEATAAHALLSLNQSAAARPRLEQALNRAQALQLIRLQVHCLTGLGLAAQAEGDVEEAARRFESAIHLFDQQRRALPCDEMRSALLANHLRPYQELLRMALNQAHPEGHEVLRRLDHLRARALGERLLQGGRAEGDGATRELRTRLNWLYRHVNGRGDGTETSPGMAAELRRTEQELLERARRDRLLADGPQTGSNSADFDTAALCALLKPADALVEYGVLDDELFVCLVRPAGVQVIRHLAPWHEVSHQVRSVRFQIDTLRLGQVPLAQHLETLQRRAAAHLQRLYQLVWAPMAVALEGCERVLLVPHGELGAVPFAALQEGEHSLGQRHLLAFAPSAQIAARMLSSPSGPTTSALALGDSQHLVHAGQEARAVAALFGKGVAAVDREATIDSLRTLSAGAGVVHLACHAEFRRDNPMFSALHLADGPLTAELVEGLRLPGALVVLSACETGLAGQPSGDELVGLVRAFMVAGASRVLATLWPVDDAVTLEFMRHFYQALCSGQTPCVALQQAQAWVRTQHPHPFYWAPFVLHGAW